MTPRVVKYLKEDRGRYFYRRRVPKRHQKTLGIKVWTQPCGAVSYAEAVALVVDWTQQHNNLLASLEIPDLALQVRRNTEVQSYAPMVAKMVDTITGLETDPNVVEISPNKSKVTYDLSGFDPLEAAIAGIKEADSNPSYDSEDKLVRYRAIQEASFGMHIDPPAEQDDREEFDLVKRKLERRISGIAGDPDTISAVAQRYFKFAGIRSGVEGKYRRNISKLINHIGDLPVKHVTSKMLREFRDAQSDTMKASSLSSVRPFVLLALDAFATMVANGALRPAPYQNYHIRIRPCHQNRTPTIGQCYPRLIGPSASEIDDSIPVIYPQLPD